MPIGSVHFTGCCLLVSRIATIGPGPGGPALCPAVAEELGSAPGPPWANNPGFRDRTCRAQAGSTVSASRASEACFRLGSAAFQPNERRTGPNDWNDPRANISLLKPF